MNWLFVYFLIFEYLPGKLAIMNSYYSWGFVPGPNQGFCPWTLPGCFSAPQTPPLGTHFMCWLSHDPLVFHNSFKMSSSQNFWVKPCQVLWLTMWTSFFLTNFNLPMQKARETKQLARKFWLQNCLIWSGACLNTKGHALEFDYYREELFHFSDKVTWAMRQHGPSFFLHYRSPVRARLTK